MSLRKAATNPHFSVRFRQSLTEGNIVSCVFTPALAKYTNSFTLVGYTSVASTRFGRAMKVRYNFGTTEREKEGFSGS